MNTLPIQREVLLDKNYKFRKCYECGSLGSIHTEPFAIFDKDALKYIQKLIDVETNAGVKEVMESILCLQMFCYDMEGTEVQKETKKKGFMKVVKELNKYAVNGYGCNDKALWWTSDVIVQKEDLEVISLPGKFKKIVIQMYESWKKILCDSYLRNAVELTYEECNVVTECFNDLVRYGKCFYNEHLAGILKSNNIKFTRSVLENYKKELYKKLLVFKKKMAKRLNMSYLTMYQRLPLNIKVQKTLIRIREWYEYWNGEVYISYSGGKDSTVLAHLVRSIYPDVPCVFADTGLEDPRVRAFALNTYGVEVVKPEMSFLRVIKEEGIPIISKSQAMAIRKLTTQNLTDAYRNKLMYGDERGTAGKLSDKWHYLLDAPFKISERCCDIMKKKPFKAYEKKTGRKPFVGVLAEESENRKIEWLNAGGCNAFTGDKPKSIPLGFWTEQDILQYIKDNNIPYAEAYGDIIEIDGKLETTKESRTGCMFCCFGVHLEKDRNGENRFQRMAREFPKQHKYCIEKLGLDVALNYMNVDYLPII